MGSTSLRYPWQSNNIQNNNMLISRRPFLPKTRKKLGYLHLKGFLEYNCEPHFKKPLTPPKCNIIAAYCTSNHRLAIETWQWSTIPISRDTRLCHLCSNHTIENEAHFVLECPLYKPIADKFPLLFRNGVLGSLKSFLQLNHQVDISFHLMEATVICHSNWFETIMMYF